jgi:hypothetical protein
MRLSRARGAHALIEASKGALVLDGMIVALHPAWFTSTQCRETPPRLRHGVNADEAPAGSRPGCPLYVAPRTDWHRLA